MDVSSPLFPHATTPRLPPKMWHVGMLMSCSNTKMKPHNIVTIVTGILEAIPVMESTPKDPV